MEGVIEYRKGNLGQGHVLPEDIISKSTEPAEVEKAIEQYIEDEDLMPTTLEKELI